VDALGPVPIEGPPRRRHPVVRSLIILESIAVVALLTAILAIASIQVVSRYVFNVSVQWTEELAQLALVWLVFIGAGLVSAHDSHVTIRVLGRALGPTGRRLLAAFAYLVVIGGCGLVLWLGWAPMLSRMERPLPASHWPAGLHYLAVMIGFGLILFHTSLGLWSLLRGGYVEAPEDVDEPFPI
jgi:TRAP-type C4-dicarboxylate transport system permease small subunit